MKNIYLKKTFLKKNFFHIGILICLAIICLYPIRDLDFPAVLNDEFGYWANAVSFFGYNWKELIAETPYYSWGYSVWLIPLTAIFKEYYILYKVAIVLNLLFLFVSYFCCYYIGRKIFDNCSKYQIAVVSFLVIIYPSNIVYAQVSWSESLLYMLMWLTTVLIYSIEENYKLYKVLICVCLLGYMYIVHQRSIGIVLAAIISLFLIRKKENGLLKSFIIPFVLLIIFFIINSVVKNIQLEYLWSNSEISFINNVSLNGATIGGYIDKALSNFGNLIISALGKTFYLLIASYMTILVGVFFCIKKTLFYLKKNSKFGVFYFFVGLSLVIMLCVCSVQTIDFTERKDMVVYSRYMENAMGPILLISFMSVINKFEKFRTLISVGFALVIASIYGIYLIIKDGKGIFNTVCSPVLGAVYEEANKNVEEMFVKIGFIIIITVILLILFSFFRSKTYRILGLCVIFTILYLWIGYYGESYVLNWRKSIDQNITLVRDYIIQEYPDSDIYYLKDQDVDEYSMNPKYMQFMLPDKPIHIIDEKEIEKLYYKNDIILLINPRSNISSNNIILEYETTMINLCRINDG